MDNIIEEVKKIDLDLTHYEEWQMWVVGGATHVFWLQN